MKKPLFVAVLVLALSLEAKANEAPVPYKTLLAHIASEQLRLQALYQQPRADKAAIIAKARQYILQRLVLDVFPAWYGTPWAFYGTSATPKQGAVACGYFVFGVLRDVGFKLPRAKLAQLPSETAIQHLVSPKQLKRFSKASLEQIGEHLSKHGHGLYLAGLDSHIGFVVYDEKGARFVHSSYYNPPLAVVSEPLEGPNPFYDSKYRVIAPLLDDTMLQRWLSGEAFVLTRTPH
ncbi:MAG: hypothetical protein FWC28_07685 [Proteobacteria bacterium]|nr:hypothetical protein [Cystobacterineae bacterium]MCL2258550.1 hypothetical protein [Cystobacterineae bacterium]MCL2315113.1 hypothetical protein [Pseudomonadota bacterium]